MSTLPTQSENPASRPARRVGMADRTTRGLLWMFARTLTNKGATVGSQIVLAWLLLPEDFGLFGMAITVNFLASLIEWVGTRDVLVRRGRRIHHWLAPGLWMSLSVGMLASLMMLALAPVAAWAYGEPAVASLIAILAIRPPLQALAIPPGAYLQITMRFRAIALIGILHIVFGAGLSVLLALWGFGAYSFVIPIPVSIGIQSLAFWLVARPRMRWRLAPRRWRYLLGDSLVLTGANLLLALVSHGDYLVLGLFHDTAVVGVYFFAFTLSVQVLRIMTLNLTQVLMPVISHLKYEPERQMLGFLRASEGLIAIGLPVCVMNAAIAEPLFHLLFGTKWDAAIPVFQVLCLGLAIRITEGASFAMLKGTGQYGRFFRLALIGAPLFIVPAAFAAAWGGTLAVAWTVTLWSALFGPAAMYVSIRSLGGRWSQVFHVFLAPLGAAAGGIGLAYALARAVPAESVAGQGLAIALTVGLGGGLYLGLLRVMAPSTTALLLGRLRMLLSRPAGARAGRATQPPMEC
ncbi:MAG: lipopolysaccharide biosynthesis protein [Phycisphaeraceae bacterium]